MTQHFSLFKTLRSISEYFEGIDHRAYFWEDYPTNNPLTKGKPSYGEQILEHLAAGRISKKKAMEALGKWIMTAEQDPLPENDLDFDVWNYYYAWQKEFGDRKKPPTIQ